MVTVGTVASPLAISAAPTPLNQILVLSGYGGAADEQARRLSFDYLRTIDLGNSMVARFTPPGWINLVATSSLSESECNL